MDPLPTYNTTQKVYLEDHYCNLFNKNNLRNLLFHTVTSLQSYCICYDINRSLAEIIRAIFIHSESADPLGVFRIREYLADWLPISQASDSGQHTRLKQN